MVQSAVGTQIGEDVGPVIRLIERACVEESTVPCYRLELVKTGLLFAL